MQSISDPLTRNTGQDVDYASDLLWLKKVVKLACGAKRKSNSRSWFSQNAKILGYAQDGRATDSTHRQPDKDWNSGTCQTNHLWPYPHREWRAILTRPIPCYQAPHGRSRRKIIDVRRRDGGRGAGCWRRGSCKCRGDRNSAH